MDEQAPNQICLIGKSLGNYRGHALYSCAAGGRGAYVCWALCPPDALGPIKIGPYVSTGELVSAIDLMLEPF